MVKSLHMYAVFRGKAAVIIFREGIVMKKTLKRTLSLILSLIMIFCVVQTGIVVSSAASSKAASAICGNLTFVVPEQIYLAPDALSGEEYTSGHFSLYVNNTSSYGTTASRSSTSGKIYFRYSTAQNASISYRFLDMDSSENAVLQGGSITLSKSTSLGTSSDIGITAGYTPSLSKWQKGCYIEWILSFRDTVDGKDKKAYAYTYCYKPYIYPVAAGADAGTGTSSGANWAGQATWISGFHSLVAGSNTLDSDWEDSYQNQYTKLSTFNAFISSRNLGYDGALEITDGQKAPLVGSYTVNPANTGGTSDYLVFYRSKVQGVTHILQDGSNNNPSFYGDSSSGSGKAPVTNYCVGKYRDLEKNIQACVKTNSYGYITVDTSRYTNLNQIPNLSIGLIVTDDESSEDDKGNWYIADFTGQTEAYSYITWHHGAENGNRGKGYNNHGTIIASQGDGATDTRYKETEYARYAGAYPKAIANDGKETTYWVKGFYTNEDNGYYASSHCLVSLHTKSIDKSAVRSAVANATKKMAQLGLNGTSVGIGKPSSMYFDNNNNYKWSAFANAYQAAVKALTNLESTANMPVIALNLNNALDALCTRVSYNGNGGTLSSSADAYITVGTNQTASFTTANTATRTGYNFAGWSTDPNASTGSYTLTVGYNNTLYAVWEPKTFTVSFNGNGSTGGGMEDETFSYGIAKELIPNTFERKYKVSYNATTGSCGIPYNVAEYRFLGWSNTTDVAGQYNYADRESVTNPNGSTGGNTVLYAKWEPGSVVLPNATRTGYQFAGWWSKSSGGLFAGNAGGSYMPDGETTLYAHWTNNTVNLVFNGNGNTGGSMSSQTFTYDVPKALSSNAFERKYTVTYDAGGGSCDTASAVAEYSFAGWNSAPDGDGMFTYSDRQTVTNPNAATSGGTTLYAKWTQNPVRLPSASRNGFKFAGWWTDPTEGTLVGMADVSYTPINSVTLYAHWTENPITVTFNGNGSTGGVMPNDTFKYDTAKTLTANRFERKYSVSYNANNGVCDTASDTAVYSFTGWNSSADGTGEYSYSDRQRITNPNGLISGSTTLYAQWQSGSVTLPSASRNGYEFEGWWTKPAGGGFAGNAGASYTPFGPAALYAHWSNNTVTVKFDGNGKTSGTMPYDTYKYDTEKALTANRFERKYKVTYNANTGTCSATGDTAVYTFTGWNSAAGGDGTYTYTDGQLITNPNGATGGTTTLYAKWQPGSVTLPAPSKTGYTFAGWWTQASGGVRAGEAGTAYVPDADTTLYAHWTPTDYSVSYNLDGGSAENPALYNIETETFTLEKPVKAGYSFAGWTGTGLDAAASSVTVEKGSTGDRSYTANWTVNTYTLTFNKNDGTGGTESIDIEFGSVLPDIEVPSREGYIFNGYYLVLDGDTVYYYQTGANLSKIRWQNAFDAELIADWTAEPAAPGKDFGVVDVKYTPGSERYKDFIVKVIGRAYMVQFVLPSGNTETVERNDKDVTVISCNAAGEQVSDTSRELAYEIWMYNHGVTKNGMLRCRAKFINPETGRGEWELTADDERIYTFKMETLPSGAVTYNVEAPESGKLGSRVYIKIESVADLVYVRLDSESGRKYYSNVKNISDGPDGHKIYAIPVTLKKEGSETFKLYLLKTDELEYQQDITITVTQ